MQAVDMRETQLNIRLSDEEAERFKRVADHYGLNVAGTIRMLFKEKARDLGFEPINLATAVAAKQGHEPAKSLMAARLAAKKKGGAR